MARRRGRAADGRGRDAAAAAEPAARRVAGIDAGPASGRRGARLRLAAAPRIVVGRDADAGGAVQCVRACDGKVRGATGTSMAAAEHFRVPGDGRMSGSGDEFERPHDSVHIPGCLLSCA